MHVILMLILYMAPRFYLLLDRMIRSVNFMIFVHEWMYYFNGFALDPW